MRVLVRSRGVRRSASGRGYVARDVSDSPSLAEPGHSNKMD